ncbi:helix-turn-helix domain-containing protein [Streptomyces sp. NPDC018610]|uniref:helix-turn-helix domain-containing protein n=1 Tax=Streptomyces sp. NPDC018610 TaxID=3365049 RepID=UPI0037A94179
MDRMKEISGFLRSRRARITPEATGLPSDGRVRRVPGLRRDEAARLAGVSTEYYTRLEQGRAANPSPEVVEAIARALRLDETERDTSRTSCGPPPGPHAVRRPGPSGSGRACA